MFFCVVSLEATHFLFVEKVVLYSTMHPSEYSIDCIKERERFMKNAKRFFVITFMLAFIISISSINAFAATVTQDNLEVTLVTDKEKS